MPKPVCHLPVTMVACITSHTSLCGICGVQSGIGTGPSLNMQFSPLYYLAISAFMYH
jgi:hypothetical protein